MSWAAIIALLLWAGPALLLIALIVDGGDAPYEGPGERAWLIAGALGWPLMLAFVGLRALVGR